MKSFLIFLLGLLLFSASIPAQNNGIPQSSEFLVIPTGDKFLRWQGHLGRSYFLQVSDAANPLEKWSWVPIIESGNNEEISYEVDGTAAKGFFRLKYTDQVPGPGESLETADFDDDGISNIDEIDPPAPLSAIDATDPLDDDTDADGMKDGYERIHGLDPNDDGTTDPDSGPTGDPDGDGLSNAGEMACGTDPNDPDSDGDGLLDGVESDSGTNPSNSDSDGDGLLDSQDADPKEILVNWEKTPESSYLMFEITTLIEDMLAYDLNDKGEVLVPGGIWVGGECLQLDAADITGTTPDESPYDVEFGGWVNFNNDRMLLGYSRFHYEDSDSRVDFPAIWPANQSSPSFLIETADLWESFPYFGVPFGVAANGSVVIRMSTGWNDYLDRFDAAGASAGRMGGSGGYYPIGGSGQSSGHGSMTPSGWVASNLQRPSTETQPAAYRLGLWDAANNPVALPPEANSWGYPVNVTDLPNGKVALIGGTGGGPGYIGRAFLPDATGQYKAVPSLSAHKIERFAGDGSAITRDHKLWRNGKLIPLRDLCERYGELLDAGWKLWPLKSNKHGVYLIAAQDPNGVFKSLLLQPYRFELRHENEEVDVFKGWDDTGAQPWVSVGVDKTKTIVRLNLIGFTPELATLLELVPKAGSENFISLQNHTIEGQETKFDITGIAATPTVAGCQIVVREKANHDNISKPLNVHVLPARVVNFAVYHAWDEDIEASKLTAALPSLAAITEELNKTFTDQTNITFNLCRPEIEEFDNCADVISADGKVYARTRTGRTENDTVLLTKKASEAGAGAQPPGPGKHLKLFVVKGVVDPGKGPIVGLALRPGSWGIMAEDASVRVYSHEAGHALGLTAVPTPGGEAHEMDSVQGPNRVKPLMRRKSGGTSWMRREDWFEANTKAKGDSYGH